MSFTISRCSTPFSTLSRRHSSTWWCCCFCWWWRWWWRHFQWMTQVRTPIPCGLCSTFSVTILLLQLLIMMIMMMNDQRIIARLIVKRWWRVQNSLWIDLVGVHGLVISDVTVGRATGGRDDRKYSMCWSTFGRCHFPVSGSINLTATEWRHIRAKADVVTVATRWHYRCNPGTCTQWRHTLSSAINDVMLYKVHNYFLTNISPIFFPHLILSAR